LLRETHSDPDAGHLLQFTGVQCCKTLGNIQYETENI